MEFLWHPLAMKNLLAITLILLACIAHSDPIVSVLSFKPNVIVNGQHVNQLVTSCTNTLSGHSYLWERNTTSLVDTNAWVPLTGFSGGGVAVRTNGIPVGFKFAFFRVRDTTP
jgi:hypothetical protein